MDGNGDAVCSCSVAVAGVLPADHHTPVQVMHTDRLTACQQNSGATDGIFGVASLQRSWRSLGASFLFLMLVCHPLAAVSQTSIGAPFPIASNWASVGAAFDGTNYLVAMETGSHNASVAGQLISQNGTRVGPLIAVGSVGQTCCNAVAFDGTNYLMVWEDDSVGAPIGTTSGFTAKGQFINTAGTTLGQPFVLTNTDIWLDGLKFLAFGGGKYLLTYRKLTTGATGNSNYAAGRIISPDGTLGNELRLSAGYGSGGSNGTMSRT